MQRHMYYLYCWITCLNGTTHNHDCVTLITLERFFFFFQLQRLFSECISLYRILDDKPSLWYPIYSTSTFNQNTSLVKNLTGFIPSKQELHVLFTLSYKSCLPVSHRHDIQKRNRLDRYRIRNTLKRFLKKLGNSSVDEYSLKLKYLVEMAGIVPTLGSEVYHISAGSSQSGGTFTHVKVTGEIGIQTSGSRYPDGSLVSSRYVIFLVYLCHSFAFMKIWFGCGSIGTRWLHNSFPDLDG